MFKNLKWKFTRFMWDRYGIDQLYVASGLLFIGLQFLNLFLKSHLLSIVLLIFVLWIFYRVFSKNRVARQAENQTFLTITGQIKSKGKNFTRRVRDMKTHRYRDCTNCATTLRLPRKRGSHKVRCPRCGNLFDVKIRI